ncbi:MAG: pentapeptide repeat-containing protein [Armatimonadetes bacterium]|nr:pentapeptide repeat-containing protein [Candidatus Hippobium faecium]
MFSACNLKEALIENSDLRETLFIKADLRGASLKGSQLSKTSFEDAKIKGLKMNMNQALYYSQFCGIITEE